MPAPANNAVAVRRDGDALVFSGALLREAVPALWRELLKDTAGLRRLDLTAVERLDSAGLALLSTLAARADGGVTVSGNPAGLDALRGAYRLDDALGFTIPDSHHHAARDGVHMIRPTLFRHATLLSLALLASACASNGGTRNAADASTRVPAAPAAAAADPAAAQPGDDAMPAMPAPVDSDADVAAAGDASGAAPPQDQAGATQAEQDFNDIYGAPYDPVADPTLPTPYAAPLSYDPWEGFNRRVHAFNKVVDRTIAKPLANAYVKVVPEPARNGVTNFFNNLGQPVTIVNALLQGKGKVAVQSLGRFALNTTVGIGGIFDPATRVKIPNRSEDFGQTMGVWGWKRSRYLELPLFGPRTVRDTFGIVGDAPLSPVRYIEDDKTRIFLQGLELVNVRTQLFPLDNLTVGAADEYALIRDSWLQRRDYQISGGRDAQKKDGEEALPDYLIEDDSNPGAPAGVMPIIPGSGVR